MITLKEAREILSKSVFSFESAGPCASLALSDEGYLGDDWYSEPADLSSESAFQAQVNHWLG